MWQDVKNVYHLVIAVLANLWYGFPGRRLTVIGVTGTDGKTTTVYLIHHILTIAGKQASMVSSIGAVINGKEHDTGFHVTTPSPSALQRFIKKAVGKGDRGDKGFLVLEVTSHAIDQNRIWGIPFTIAVLTNVTPEHLDYHKTFEEYVMTKIKLLEMAKIVVVNRDDDSYHVIKSEIRISKSETNSKFKIQKLKTYGLRRSADVNPQSFPFKTKLIGEYNRYNVLAAIAACRTLGIEEGIIRKGIESFMLPVGRCEVVHENDFRVIIDFAHTPNAIEQLLCSIRPSVRGRLIHLFGSAGERDRQKRPKMGCIASKYADVVILTVEDPRSEPVESIIDQIESGIRNQELGRVRKIPNRQEAINEAVKMARSGDVVVITGKGHERSMNYGRGEEPWSEHEAVKKALILRARGPVAGFPPASARSSLSASGGSNELRAVGSPPTRTTPRL